ncbi:MAG: hypothetical protein QNJ31_05025 [Candidatus Caenarcaniphilales bacterium]|nr:hypothetical protein [Candidatus Caenarcaniphilales bacterium]
MKKQREIKQKPKKVKADLEKWINISKKIIQSRKKDFSLLKRIFFWVKKQKNDPEKESSKELIQAMDSRKLLLEEAQQIAIASATKLQSLQKELPKLLIYLLGGGTMIICSVVFITIRSPRDVDFITWIKDFNVIFWLVMIILNSAIFFFGLQKRKTFADNLSINSILSQAATAYASSKAPGQGGSLFEAYKALDIIKDKNRQAFNKKFGFGKKK